MPVVLNGSESESPDDLPLSYFWTLEDKPEGSQAGLADADSVVSTFTPDLAGTYLVSLVVSDGQETSETDELIVRASRSPVALAGPDSTVFVTEDYVRLDGSGSYDPDGDELAYAWVLVSAPDSSEKQIYEEDTHLVILKTDVEGSFVLELTVSDGTSQSEPDTAIVTVLGAGTGIDSQATHDLANKGIQARIFPNPSTGTIYIDLPEGEKIRLIEVMGTDGRILQQISPRTDHPDPFVFRIRGNEPAPRMLLLKLTCAGGVSLHRLILE
jgi:hypothetical protein